MAEFVLGGSHKCIICGEPFEHLPWESYDNPESRSIEHLAGTFGMYGTGRCFVDSKSYLYDAHYACNQEKNIYQNASIHGAVNWVFRNSHPSIRAKRKRTYSTWGWRTYQKQKPYFLVMRQRFQKIRDLFDFGKS